MGMFYSSFYIAQVWRTWDMFTDVANPICICKASGVMLLGLIRIPRGRSSIQRLRLNGASWTQPSAWVGRSRFVYVHAVAHLFSSIIFWSFRWYFGNKRTGTMSLLTGGTSTDFPSPLGTTWKWDSQTVCSPSSSRPSKSFWPLPVVEYLGAQTDIFSN